jgi:hypothetical protein
MSDVRYSEYFYLDCSAGMFQSIAQAQELRAELTKFKTSDEYMVVSIFVDRMRSSILNDVHLGLPGRQVA